MDPKGQIVLITGGASGIGKECAQKLHQVGAKVIVWDLNIENGCQEVINFIVDVSNPVNVENAFAKTIETAGIPRILINCAGVAPAKRIISRKNPNEVIKEFIRVININLIGTFNVMRTVASAMVNLPLIDEERGVIINTASIAAFEGQIGQVAYSASKGGVVAMTLPAARELADHAIRVNTIAPGLIATPLLLNMPEEIQANLAAAVPFPKRFGKTAEYAQLAMQIIENTLINGAVIRLDGALRMQAR